GGGYAIGRVIASCGETAKAAGTPDSPGSSRAASAAAGASPATTASPTITEAPAATDAAERARAAVDPEAPASAGSIGGRATAISSEARTRCAAAAPTAGRSDDASETAG